MSYKNNNIVAQSKDEDHYYCPWLSSTFLHHRLPVRCLLSGVVFASLLPLVQLAGKTVRISCISRAGSLLGGAGVALVSIASIQAVSLAVSLKPDCFQRVLDTEALVVPAISGMIAFKMLGGKFCNILPSDLRYPGALAKVSLPANGRGYAGLVERDTVRALFKQIGCHHCGRKTGKSVSDHMPPNLMVHGNSKTVQKIRPMKKSQRFYPQCENCTKLQSAALRHGHNPLVLHWRRGWPEPCSFAGFILGALHFTSDSGSAASHNICCGSMAEVSPRQTKESTKRMMGLLKRPS